MAHQTSDTRRPSHYNPTPKFGLWTEQDLMERDAEIYRRIEYQDGWCIDCGDAFHLDDCGGYNPPCVCGFHCRSCHEAEERDEDAYEDGYDDDHEERD